MCKFKKYCDNPKSLKQPFMMSCSNPNKNPKDNWTIYNETSCNKVSYICRDFKPKHIKAIISLSSSIIIPIIVAFLLKLI